jgi:sulfite reductase (ferredoxin)
LFTCISRSTIVCGGGKLGRATPWFMVRIRVPNGILTAAQTRVIATLAARYGRGLADLTVRENVQLHWVELAALPEVFRALRAAGIPPLGACGDVVRNITGCPLAGVEGDELVDASPLVRAANAALAGREAFYNLPRKFKATITGCAVWCSYPEINDVGLTAVRAPDGTLGYSLRVGGGLSTEPHLARRLPVFVRPDEVVDVVRAVAEIFRDAAELRRNRAKARLKYLFLEHGWTTARFQEELERRLGRALAPPAPETAPDDVYRDHVGIHAQRQPGLAYAGFAVLSGRTSAAALAGIADLAERHGDGTVRVTAMQNLVVTGIPASRAAAVAREAEAAGLALDASPFWRGAIACTGTEFCKLALSETKAFTADLVRTLERRLPAFAGALRISTTGCPNACGQHWIADIGLQGGRTKIGDRQVDAYDVLLGGGLGARAGFARRVGFRAPASEVADALERLLRAYLQRRLAGEGVPAFFARHGDEELRAFLAGEILAEAQAGR